MLELILDLQSERIDSQRALLNPAKKIAQPTSSPHKSKHIEEKPDEDFFDMLAKVQVSVNSRCKQFNMYLSYD